METHGVASGELESALTHLSEHGYAVIEGVLSGDEIQHYRSLAAVLFERERAHPFEPEDGPALPGDAEIEAYLKESYQISEAEQARLMRRIRHTRAQNRGTPWPVAPSAVVKNFLHLPTLFDYDQSQRIWNLVNKAPDFGKLIEHPAVLFVGAGGSWGRLRARRLQRHQYWSSHRRRRGMACGCAARSVDGTAAGLSVDHSKRLDVRCVHNVQRGNAGCS